MSLILISGTDFIELFPEDYRHFYRCLNNLLYAAGCVHDCINGHQCLRLLRNCTSILATVSRDVPLGSPATEGAMLTSCMRIMEREYEI
jgi:hypothetical protein